MIYAPVLIPTLNRKEHLARCLKSLSKNGWAKYTDVYISVDYPPNNSYVNGYLEVKKFLENIDEIKVYFKKIEIFYQNRNIGPHNNYLFLVKLISNTYDRFIFTEDDNEFSVNFIEYIDKSLFYFENDERVYAISGFRDADYLHPNGSNVIATKLFPAYGLGCFIKNNELFNDNITQFLLKSDTYNRNNLISLKKNNRILYNFYIVEVLLGSKSPFWNNGKLSCIDTVVSIYMHLTDTICISPATLKSRTWGNDGSGVNMRNRKVNVQEIWKLDSSKYFEVNTGGVSVEFDNRNYKIGEKSLEVVNSIKFNIKADIYYLLLVLCKYNRLKASKIVKHFLEHDLYE